MATAWLTYAWDDNKASDVEFIAQELGRAGVTMKLDSWQIGAGQRLWEQIANFISDSAESDAWILYATQNSLGSEACKEEYSYALDRALHQRGTTFPIIALFPSAVEVSILPAGLRTRLNVSITDPEWKERIKAAAEGRAPDITSVALEAFTIGVSRSRSGFVIEVRPRAGTWSPFFAAIPATERDRLKPRILHGPRGHIPHGGMLISSGTRMSDDGAWYVLFARNEATPTQSYYVFCNELPSVLFFGVLDDGPQYVVIPA